MYRTGAVLGGLLGGVLGAIIWAAVALLTEYEYSWIAWGTGGLVGFGVAIGNRGKGSTAAGALAVLIAAMSIVGAKYVAIVIAAPAATEIVDMYMSNFGLDEEYVVSFVADVVAAEYLEVGRSVEWPAGVDPTNAAAESDYPPDVWSEAMSRWGNMTGQDRADFRAELEPRVRANLDAAAPQLRAQVIREGFRYSFGLMDVAFFGMAVLTAFSIGASGGKTEESEGEDSVVMADSEDSVTLEPVGDFYQRRLSHRDTELAVRVMARMPSAAGNVAAIRDTYRRLVGDDLSEEEITEESDAARSSGEDLNAFLERMAPNLSEAGRELVMKAAFMVVAADDMFSEQEVALLGEMATAVGLSQAQLQDLLAGLMERD